ncbi:putative alpha-mannosidase I MNS4 [Carex littledalei]|uniref:alpha-1,2-Mannosidase n=1 Tax=Carex littledalei TaxID=544730 RepID=A0A833VY95_9POAL|nr:putative alpha-mannosidase I MNS4 [Carex littledalei]
MRQQHWLWLLYFVFVAIYANLRADGDGISPQEAKQLRDEVRDMFYHTFNGYMKHTFPLDELRPLSCKGQDFLGGYALTLINSLDTLALLGDRDTFSSAVQSVSTNVQFNIVISGIFVNHGPIQEQVISEIFGNHGSIQE